MRINRVLQIVKEHLAGYYDLAGKVDIWNAGVKTNQPFISILVTLIKIAEENILRNGRFSKKNQNFKIIYENRLVYTNLYILFSCNNTDYNSPLHMLSQVVKFFQGQKVITHLDGQSGVINNIG